MVERKRFYTSAQINDDKVLIKVFARIIFLARTETIKKVVFVGLNFNNTAMIEDLFKDDAVVKKMNKGGFAVPSTKINMQYTSKDKYHPIEGEIIAPIGLRSDEILELEDYNPCLAVIAIPYIENEIEKWCRISQAQEITTNVTLPLYNDIECILKQALSGIHGINRSSSNLSSGDKDRVATYFKELLENKISLDNEDEIEAYLLNSLKWLKQNVKTVFAVMQKLKSGGRVQFERLNKPGTFYMEWRKTCDNIAAKE